MKKVLSYIKSFLLCLISFPLSAHGKRIVLMTTVFMQLSNMQKYNHDKMAELNNFLHLAKDDNALEFPTFLNGLIWGSGIPEIKTIKTDEAIQYLSALTPTWLRYNQNQMQDDFKKILLNTGTAVCL